MEVLHYQKEQVQIHLKHIQHTVRRKIEVEEVSIVATLKRRNRSLPLTTSRPQLASLLYLHRPQAMYQSLSTNHFNRKPRLH